MWQRYLSLLATVDYTYDGYQRLTQEDHHSADGTTLNKQVYHTYNKQTETHRTVTDKESTETFVYDAQWNIVSQSDATGTTTYTYDAAGRVVKVSSPGYPVTSTYNTYGLCISVSNTASGTTTYTYNGLMNWLRREMRMITLRLILMIWRGVLSVWQMENVRCLIPIIIKGN